MSVLEMLDLAVRFMSTLHSVFQSVFGHVV